MMPPGHGGPPGFWTWGRGRRNPETGPANSGLTGDPVIEEPVQPQGPKDLGSRWKNRTESVRGTTAELLIDTLISYLGSNRDIEEELVRIDGSMRSQVMVIGQAASLDLALYEEHAAYGVLRRPEAAAINRPVQMISSAFGVVQAT